jgi:6-phosphogluconolactonase
VEHSPTISVFETPDQLAIAAAERFVEEANRQQERFSVALAGGTTPRRVYELLGSKQFKDRIEWSNVFLFFGDERCVPPAHPDSNYAMVRAALISKVPIPPANVRRIKGEMEPAESALEYEKEVREFFPGVEWPRFDLVLLGMGEDGHTASLFPGSQALEESSRWVLATRNEDSGQDRITLTLPLFNHAAHVIFIVTGEKKAQRLAKVLRPKVSQEQFPAQLVNPYNGKLEWLVDAAAATGLRP